MKLRNLCSLHGMLGNKIYLKSNEEIKKTLITYDMYAGYLKLYNDRLDFYVSNNGKTHTLFKCGTIDLTLKKGSNAIVKSDTGTGKTYITNDLITKYNNKYDDKLQIISIGSLITLIAQHIESFKKRIWISGSP